MSAPSRQICDANRLPGNGCGGFLYLVAIIDWHSRKVLAWRISNTLEAAFCVEALNQAIHKFGLPEIVNTDSHRMVTSSRVV